MLDGVSTLPPGLPELTLGYEAIKHGNRWLKQPNGPRRFKPWEPTLSQARWLLWWYSVDESGEWIYHHGVRRLAKGAGKSPFAAVQCHIELTGPVRLKDFDPNVPGGCVGEPQPMALVQIVATAESQTANTMRMVRAMAIKGSEYVEHFGIDVGLTRFYVPDGGQLEIITSSAAAAEGAECTFAVEDETEHWLPAAGGPKLAETLERNLAKSASRGIETANAWEPGTSSVAEDTYDAWKAQQENGEPGGILYDARIAPADIDMGDEDSVLRGLDFVYDDCFWVKRKELIKRIFDRRTAEDVIRRFYFNQPTASVDAWTTPMEWKALEAGPVWRPPLLEPLPARQIQDGEAVVLFFDGSKSRDGTGIVGCAMSDGHVFTVGGWEPKPAHNTDDVVPVTEVDAAIARAFDQYDVVAFFADVQEWEGFVKDTWPAKYKDKLLIRSVPTGRDPQWIAWDMRSHGFDFVQAAEMALSEIEDGSFTHDGHPMLERHVVNARRNTRTRYGGVSVKKESPDSPRKIDLCVCMIGARMVRRIVLGSKEWQKHQRKGTGRGWIILLDD